MSKIRLASLLLLILALSRPVPGHAVFSEGNAETPPVAQPLPALAVFSSGADAGAVVDQKQSTYAVVPAGEEIVLSSEHPFTSLYLIWDAPPSEFTVGVSGSTAHGGAHGFLHEHIALPAQGNTAVLTLAENASSAALCEVFLFGEGMLPDWVQRWQPPLEKADLLALPTHADDEHLFFGGILPTYAGQHGMAVQVVYLTNHFAERYRPHELLDGLWTVGVTAYPVMGPFADAYASLESLQAAEGVYGREEVLAFQVEMLRRFRPSVVVGHDLQGEYGHGAHILNAETLLQALEFCGDETAFPESAAAYGVSVPQKVYLHLYAENELVLDWNQPLSHFGGATAFEMAVKGFSKHVSQRQWFSVQQTGNWEDCRRFGLAYTTVGPDLAKDDLFEHIPAQEAEQGPPGGSVSRAVSSSGSDQAPPHGQAASSFGLRGGVSFARLPSAALPLTACGIVLVRCAIRGY